MRGDLDQTFLSGRSTYSLANLKSPNGTCARRPQFHARLSRRARFQPRVKLVSVGINLDRRQATVQSNEGYKIPGGRRKRNARGRQKEEEGLEGRWDSEE